MAICRRLIDKFFPRLNSVDEQFIHWLENAIKAINGDHGTSYINLFVNTHVSGRHRFDEILA